MLKFLGKIGKGFGTIVGVVTAVGGAVADPGAVADAARTIIEHVPVVVTAVGTVLAAFGIGRKARDRALKGD